MTMESTRPRGAPQRLRRLNEGADKALRITPQNVLKTPALAVVATVHSQREHFRVNEL
jgi:hypothetical protein